jgi:hypothetical protein
MNFLQMYSNNNVNSYFVTDANVSASLMIYDSTIFNDGQTIVIDNNYELKKVPDNSLSNTLHFKSTTNDDIYIQITIPSSPDSATYVFDGIPFANLEYECFSKSGVLYFDFTTDLPRDSRNVSHTIQFSYNSSGNIGYIQPFTTDLRILLPSSNNQNAHGFLIIFPETNIIQYAVVQENGTSFQIIYQETFLNVSLNQTDIIQIDATRVLLDQQFTHVFLNVNLGVIDLNSFTGLSSSSVNNIFVGTDSGFNNKGGFSNLFMGHESGKFNIDGKNNVFLGNGCGFNNRTGLDNVFIGNESGFLNNSGTNNTFIGYRCGYNNNDGSNNIFMGYQSGYNNDGGSENIFVGYECGFQNTSGKQNIFMGYQCGFQNTTGEQNIFMGYQCGFQNTTGSRNIFIGYKTGRENTTGSGNIIIGIEKKDGSNTYETNDGNIIDIDPETNNINVIRGEENDFRFITVITDKEDPANIETSTTTTTTSLKGKTGTNNTILGVDAGSLYVQGSGTGVNNVLIGHSSGQSSDQLVNNTYLGYLSGENSNSVINNTLLGALTCSDNGNIGNYNTFIGYASGKSQLISERCLFAGDFSGYNQQLSDHIISLGSSSGYNMNQCSEIISLGHSSCNDATVCNHSIFIGNNSGYSANNINHSICLGENVCHYSLYSPIDPVIQNVNFLFGSNPSSSYFNVFYFHLIPFIENNGQKLYSIENEYNALPTFNEGSYVAHGNVYGYNVFYPSEQITTIGTTLFMNQIDITYDPFFVSGFNVSIQYNFYDGINWNTVVKNDDVNILEDYNTNVVSYIL